MLQLFGPPVAGFGGNELPEGLVAGNGRGKYCDGGAKELQEQIIYAGSKEGRFQNIWDRH